ncbi:MAG: YfcC family protein [bacterium]|nr:YfcC family protein [bacterium]
MTLKKLNSKKGGEESKKTKKKFKSPSAFSVLFIIIAIMAGLTWLIPSGRYQYVENEAGDSVIQAGSYSHTTKELTVVEEYSKDGAKDSEISIADAQAKKYSSDPKAGDKIYLQQGFWDAFLSPIKGMSEKLDVIIFVLILGGFLGVVMKTGALDAALGSLLIKMKGKEKWLIPALMILFAIGGTTYGMQEETVAFYALVVPIMLAAGYNSMTAVMIIVLGAGSGVMASTVNPFSTGIAAKAADIQLGNVILPQLIILVLSLAAAIIFTMRYAAKVKAGKYQEDTEGKAAVKTLDMKNIPENTLERKFVVGIFSVTFLLMVISLIPWGNANISLFNDMHEWLVGLPVVGNIFGFEHGVPFGDWYFNEISALFLISTVLIAIVYKEKFAEEEVSIVDTFIAGVGDLLSVALIIAVAAGIGVLMQAGGIQDTIVSWGESLLKNVNSGVVGVIAYIFYLPMTFIIPSSSGLAAATMPIMAPVAELVGAGKEVVVVAFATASGLLNMMAPTIASLMAGLALSGVSYRKWLKRTAPIMAVFAAISIVVIVAMGMLHG